jgi:hypothetical protein
MTNVYILLLLGGVAGWTAAVLAAPISFRQTIILVAAASISSFTAGLITMGGTLYSGLDARAIGYAAGSALIATGLGLFAISKGRD